MAVRPRTGIVVAVIAAMAMTVVACGPTNRAVTKGEEQAAAARRAARELERAQARDLGCKHVVMGEEKRSTPAPEFLVFLNGAVAFSEPCWDRVAFSFEAVVGGAPPGYEVEYRRPPFTEGERNNPVSMEGDAVLSVTFTPASQTDARDPARPIQVYKGNLFLAFDAMHHVVMVRKLIDGIDTVTWLIGLDQKRPFTVDAVGNPPRVNIYIAR